jgi:general secretion pathway protein K
MRGDEQDVETARPDGGFVLIVVLWTLLFLAFAAGVFSLATRSHIRTTSAVGDRARAEALADAGAHLALIDLIDQQRDRRRQRRFPVDGRILTCSAPDGGRIAVLVRDEAGRVDLNTADERLLGALIAGLGVAPDQARRHAAAILDFRDADNARRPDGAEAEEYQQAGRTAGPKNAPFDAVAEIDQVLGLDAATLAKLRPWLTVSSGHQGVDPGFASDELVELLAAGHDKVTTLGSSAPRIEAGGRSRLPSIFAAASPQRVFQVLARGSLASGASFVREMIVHVAPSRSTPYAIRVWGQANADTVDLQRAEDVGPC